MSVAQNKIFRSSLSRVGQGLIRTIANQLARAKSSLMWPTFKKISFSFYLYLSQSGTIFETIKKFSKFCFKARSIDRELNLPPAMSKYVKRWISIPWRNAFQKWTIGPITLTHRISFAEESLIGDNRTNRPKHLIDIWDLFHFAFVGTFKANHRIFLSNRPIQPTTVFHTNVRERKKKFV